jgi:hypothetical protein
METKMSRRSFWAIVAGIVFIIVVTTLVDIALHLARVYPPPGQPMDDSLAVVATIYRVVISIAGAYLTARLAPGEPMKHALILGVGGTLLGIVGIVATWNKGLGPNWYPIALAVLAIPQCWAGGRLYEWLATNRARGGTNGA